MNTMIVQTLIWEREAEERANFRYSIDNPPYFAKIEEEKVKVIQKPAVEPYQKKFELKKSVRCFSDGRCLEQETSFA
jgi:hypothetical protein